MNETPEAYNNVLDFLYGRIDYERKDTPQRTKGFKLDRMRELLRRLGNPQDSLPIIHIAGTKGKGSTAHMIVAVLSAAGLRCGLYTSPHLETLEERFVINDTICTPAELIKLVDLVSPAVSDLDKLSETDKQSVGQPTFFEITTAMALLYFQRQNVDLAVLEVGLGGRLDSTNVCQPCVSVITSISFDHVDILGNTLRMIATEKAGIIKTGVPVICGVDQTEPKETIQRIAADLDAPLWNIHDDFHFQQPATGIEIKNLTDPHHKNQRFDCRLTIGSEQQTWTDLELGLNGEHQRNNAVVALATLASLKQQGWKIPTEAVRRGLRDVRCPARIEIIADHPTVVIDTAHNPASVNSLVKYLESLEKSSRNILVFAASHGKDVADMLTQLLPCFDIVILTRYVTNPRALSIEQLEQECQLVIDQADQLNLDNIPFIESCEDPSAAWNRAAKLAGSEDLICITGSFYLAGEIRSLVIGNPVSHVTS